MKILIQILAIFISANSVLLTQTNNDNLLNINLDSTKIKPTQQNVDQIITRFDEFELYRELNNIKMSVPIDGDPQTVWLRTSLAVSNMDNLSNNFSHHLLSPLEEQYLKNSRLNPLTYILGIVQTGAVGYLAYKHIKKYGFLK